MRSSRILDIFQSVAKPVSDYFTPVASSVAATLSSFSTHLASEPGHPNDRVEMKATKTSAAENSNIKIMERLRLCASREKNQPEIFIALLQKQELQQDQVEDFARELVKNGKARELDALAGKYHLTPEFIVENLRQADKPETYQGLLEARDEIKNLGYLFDPKSPVTIVEASDRDAIAAATLAARSTATKRIIKVDTTEEYAPHHREDVVQLQENTSSVHPSPNFFKPGNLAQQSRRAALVNRTNMLVGGTDFRSTIAQRF